jgi:hypothetical protein
MEAAMRTISIGLLLLTVSVVVALGALPEPPANTVVTRIGHTDYLSGELYLSDHSDTLLLQQMGFVALAFQGRSVGTVRYQAMWPRELPLRTLPSRISGVDYYVRETPADEEMDDDTPTAFDPAKGVDDGELEDVLEQPFSSGVTVVSEGDRRLSNGRFRSSIGWWPGTAIPVRRYPSPRPWNYPNVAGLLITNPAPHHDRFVSPEDEIQDSDPDETGNFLMYPINDPVCGFQPTERVVQRDPHRTGAFFTGQSGIGFRTTSVQQYAREHNFDAGFVIPATTDYPGRESWRTGSGYRDMRPPRYDGHHRRDRHEHP